jgi:hypothetical protein
VETYLQRQWTLADVEAAACFYRCARAPAEANVPSCQVSVVRVTDRGCTHLLAWRLPARVAHTTRASRSIPFPASCLRSLCERTTARRRSLSLRAPPHLCASQGARVVLSARAPLLVAGYFPVRLEALPEGTVVHANTPIYQVQPRARPKSVRRAPRACSPRFARLPHAPRACRAAQITAEGEYACLCTFLETVLTMVWYVRTRVRHVRTPPWCSGCRTRADRAAPACSRYPSAVATLSRRAKAGADTSRPPRAPAARPA